MPRLKKPHIATIDEITISRDGEYAEIVYHDPSVGGVNLKIGPEIYSMTDRDILYCHNRVIAAMQHAVETYRHVALEVPPGSPQVRYSDSATSGCRVGMSFAV
jgi:hypothetical protein